MLKNVEDEKMTEATETEIAAVYRMGYRDGVHAERERAKKTIEELLKVIERGKDDDRR